MTRDEVAAAFAAALERREDRRQHYRAYTAFEKEKAASEGRQLPGCGLYDGPYRDPETPAEWWDDRILERGSSHWGRPENPVLFALALALRDGGDASGALRDAGRLPAAAQFAAYQNVRGWKNHEAAHRFGAAEAAERVIRQWKRSGLAAEAPAAKAPARRRSRPWDVVETEVTA